MPITDSQRCEPLVLSPKHNTAIRPMNEIIRAPGVTILKYLHFTFMVAIMAMTPTTSSITCFSTGPR